MTTGTLKDSPRRQDKDVVLDRDEAGNVHASLPISVRHYGVEEIDWGYIGPASAELALNVLNWVLPPGVDGEAAIQCEQGECSAVAWRLHRSFMAEYLVRLPHAGGCIRESVIREWVLHHFPAGGGHDGRNGTGWLFAFMRN